MNIRSNLHTHTSFCDGQNAPEEIILKAISLNFESVGFSGHSYTPFEPHYCMTPDTIKEYILEISALKEKYKEKIDVYLGIEKEYFSGDYGYPFDFIIDSVHFLKKDGVYLGIDHTEEIMIKNVNEYFGGDYYEYAKAYFDLAAESALSGKGQIIGHFDLVTKFNEGYKFFDEDDKRYREAALGAVSRAVKSGKIFEVNTGAISRGYRKTSYPSEFLLRHIFECSGEIIFSSDSHDASTLDFGFEGAVKLAKKCGFKYAKILRKKGFEDFEI